MKTFSKVLKNNDPENEVRVCVQSLPVGKLVLQNKIECV